MATEGPREPTLTGTRTSPQDIPPLNKSQGAQTSSTPLEMSSLEAGPAAAQTEKTPPLPPAPDISPQESAPATDPILPPGPSAPIAETTSNAEHPRHTSRSYSTAIGPSSDSPVPAPPKDEAVGPTLLITLLLTSGARHPFKLDSKYLQKRNVEVAGNDPFNLSVYKLKELILREWREEWELKPVSPSYIRLISFGKLLDDKGYLKGEYLSRRILHVKRFNTGYSEMVFSP